MSNLDKNILITPGVGSSTDDPKIVFSAANTTANAQNITMRAYPTANGTLSVEGSAGQLFSITNQLTGTIFSVNDISGIPSIQVQDTGQIQLAPFGGYVTLNANVASNSNTTGALQVLGGVGVRGNVYADAVYSGNVLLSTALSSNVTYISGIDTAQNTRMTIIEGTDVGQNARMTIIEGTDVSQNARMTIIEGVDATQNTNIANKLNLTGSLNQTVSGNVTISQDLVVGGNLIITGNVNTQNVQQLAVADPLIILGIGNYSSDIKDIGFAGHYNDGTNAHAGLIRDSGTKEFYLFKGYTPELDANNNVIITDPTFTTANLNASYVKANLITYGTNYLQIAGNTTGNLPTISAGGSDTNVGINFVPQGNGTVNITSTGLYTTLNLGSTTNPGYYARLVSAVDATQPVTLYSGTDLLLRGGSNSQTIINSPNSGTAIAYRGVNQVFVPSPGSQITVNYTQLAGSGTGNSVVFSVGGSDTNIGMTLQPKGSGALNFASANVINISNGNFVTGVVMYTGGGGYLTTPTITIAPPTTSGGVTATANAYVGLWGASLANAGSGYTLNDIITFVGGVVYNDITQYQVTSVNGTGAILTTSIYSGHYGSYWTPPTGTVSVTGGTGTGATFNNLTWTVYGINVLTSGSGYVEQPIITIGNAGGSPSPLANAYAKIGNDSTIRSLGQYLNIQGVNGSTFMKFDGQTNATPALSPEYLYVQNTQYGRMNLLTLGSTNAQLWIGSAGTGVVNFSTRGTSLVTQFRIADPGSVSVNYLQVSGNTTGNAPTLSTQGSDANVNMNIVSSGNTSIIQGANNFITFGGMPGNEIVRIYKNNTIAGGYLQAGFSAPAFSFLPPQSNFGAAVLNLGLNPRVQMLGQDGYFFSTNYAEGYPGATQFKIAHNNYGSSLNWLTASGGATGNSTTMSTQGSDTNIGMSFLPKGTGAFNISTTGVINLSSNTGVTNIVATARPGGTYSSGVTVTFSPPTTAGGVTATANIQSGASSVSIVSGGTGYNIGDVITLSGGVIAVNPASVVVTGNSAGGVVTSVTNPTAGGSSSQGYYWTVPTGTISTTSSGSGIGATFTANWYWVSGYAITNAGSGYVEQPTLTFGAPAGTTGYATVGGTPTIKTVGPNLNFATPSGTALQLYDAGAATPNALVVKNGGVPQLYPLLNNSDLSISASGTGSVRLYTSTLSYTQLLVTNTTSAVNYVQITGAVTSAGPTISAQGSDPNIPLNIIAKGTSYLNLVSNQANFWQVYGNNSGGTPYLYTWGSDTNINAGIASKGSGSVILGTNGGGTVAVQLNVSHTANAVNYLQITGNTAANAVTVSAQGSDTNIDLLLQPKGTGTVLTPNKLWVAKANTVLGGLPSTINFGNYYVGLGGGEYGLNSTRLIGFGYLDPVNRAVTTYQYPAYIGFQEMQINGSTYGDLIFGTRNTIGSADVPITRMRITSNGSVVISNTAFDTLNVASGGILANTVLINQLYDHSSINVRSVLQTTGNVAANGSIVAQNIYIQGGTNYVYNSANVLASFGNHGGDTANTTVTANTTIPAPDGSYTTWQLNNNGNQTIPIFGTFQGTGAPSTNGPFTASIWLRAGTLSSAQFYLSGGSDDTICAGGLFTLTNQWQRFVVTGFTGFPTTGARIQITTNAQAGSILMWGPQVEPASGLMPRGVASPYVATYTGSTAISANNNLYVPTGNVATNNIIVGNKMSWANSNAAIVITQTYNASTNSLDVVFG